MQTHNPVIARNIPQEMANHQREAGRSLTLREFIALGLSEEQAQKHAPAAARIFAISEQRHAA